MPKYMLSTLMLLLASASVIAEDSIVPTENGGFAGIRLNPSLLCGNGCISDWSPNVIGVFGYTHESPAYETGSFDKAIVGTTAGNMRYVKIEGKFVEETSR